jgi:hypothetical protein
MTREVWLDPLSFTPACPGSVATSALKSFSKFSLEREDPYRERQSQFFDAQMIPWDQGSLYTDKWALMVPLMSVWLVTSRLQFALR